MEFADELAAELELGSGHYAEGDEMLEDHGSEDEDMVAVNKGADPDGDTMMTLPEGGVRPAEELEGEDVELLDTGTMAHVTDVAKLTTSKAFVDCLTKVANYAPLPPSDMSTSESPDNKLIVQANNYAVEIDNDVLLVHKFTRDHYSARFRELEGLVVTSALDYCRTVKAIGNPVEFGQLNLEAAPLPSATKMVVQVMAATTNGKQLTDAEWRAVDQACDMCIELEDAKLKILHYVESRMSLLAPNLSVIIGPRTATKLLGMAGGLPGLARVPACNMHLFGAQKRAALGLSTGSYSHQRRGTGFIYNSDVVQSIPEEYRLKAQRTVSAKCVLAVRMDINQQSKDDVEKKLEKLAEPPPLKIVKALPVPMEGSKKRRGGQRARRAKEAIATSELQKLQNRMKFGEQEEEDGTFDETVGLGMIGRSSGVIRANAGEARTKAKMSKANKNRLAALRAASGSGSGTQTSGLSSSVAFTPVQGLELADPGRLKRLNEANESWFEEGTFSFIPRK